MYSWVVLLPPLVALTFAFTTRQVFLALFSGIFIGVFILIVQHNDPLSLFSANYHSLFTFPRHWIITTFVYLWSATCIVGLWVHTGGIQHFAHILARKYVKSAKGALVLTWILGLVFHQGGVISSILTGSIAKPIADQHRVSHEELAYMIDSTASPIATLIPLNAWPFYVAALIVGTIPLVATSSTAISFFIYSIPYNFYALCTLASTLLFALGYLPWTGKKMQAARQRARTTGQLNALTASPLCNIKRNHYNEHSSTSVTTLFDFFFPLAILLGMTLLAFLWWQDKMLLALHSNALNALFVSAVFSSVFIFHRRGMSLSHILESCIQSCQAITVGAILIGLAMSLGFITQTLGTASYLIDLMQGNVPLIILPTLIMLLAMLISFATGTSLGTYAVVFPIALPFAYSANPDPFFIHVCFGAILGGSVFGDHCSPISDTTLVSSMFSGCDLMDHVNSQFPLALFSAGLAGILSALIVWVH